MASSPAFIASMMASICGSVVGDVLMLESCVTVEAPPFVDSVLMMGPSDVLKERPPAVDRRLVLSFNPVTVLLNKLVLPSVPVLASCSVLLESLVLPPGAVLFINIFVIFELFVEARAHKSKMVISTWSQKNKNYVFILLRNY